MQHVVFNHIEVNLLQPLTKKLIIDAFSQEVVNERSHEGSCFRAALLHVE